jgi:hypothetical protein
MNKCILRVLTVLGLCLTTLSLGKPLPEVTPKEIVTVVVQSAEDARYARLDSLGINSRDYLDKLSCMESGGNYGISNRYGMLGKYQFSPRTLRSLIKSGYLSLSQDEMDHFLTIPSAQEKAIDAFIKASDDYLNLYKMNQYIGKRIGGVKVTKEGLLAATHLVGPYAVVHFCKSGGSLEPVELKSGVVVRKHDGNGVYLTEYMRRFSRNV